MIPSSHFPLVLVHEGPKTFNVIALTSTLFLLVLKMATLLVKLNCGLFGTFHIFFFFLLIKVSLLVANGV